jgi:hypothetical protein
LAPAGSPSACSSSWPRNPRMPIRAWSARLDL